MYSSNSLSAAPFARPSGGMGLSAGAPGNDGRLLPMNIPYIANAM
jgi:hypothetical protein